MTATVPRVPEARRGRPGARVRPGSRPGRGVGRLVARVLLAVTLAAGPVQAQPADRDWPCPQRLVPQISAGAIWSGPALDEVKEHWATDADVAPLVPKLASRDTPIELAEAQIASFADRFPPEARDAKLTLLFVGVLEFLNGERSKLIEGIKRYAQRQRALADKIAATTRKLQDEPTPEIKAERDWDLRVFEDRNRSLRPVCDQPVAVEQRAFALARAIQSHLGRS